MRLLVNGLLDLAADWQQMLVILAVLSMAIGNLAAIPQSNIKRMLAYSSVAHAGYMLLALLSLNHGAASSLLFYTTTYSISMFSCFYNLIKIFPSNTLSYPFNFCCR